MEAALTFAVLTVALVLSLMLTLAAEEILLRGFFRLVYARPSDSSPLPVGAEARSDKTEAMR